MLYSVLTAKLILFYTKHINSTTDGIQMLLDIQFAHVFRYTLYHFRDYADSIIISKINSNYYVLDNRVFNIVNTNKNN